MLVENLQRQLETSMMTEFLKEIQLKYDQIRDDRNIELDYDLESGDIGEEQYLKFKETFRWEVAWQIFDEVNKDLGLNPHLRKIWPMCEELDLSCLDIEEAQAITKQKIYECSESLQ